MFGAIFASAGLSYQQDVFGKFFLPKHQSLADLPHLSVRRTIRFLAHFVSYFFIIFSSGVICLGLVVGPSPGVVCGGLQEEGAQSLLSAVFPFCFFIAGSSVNFRIEILSYIDQPSVQKVL